MDFTFIWYTNCYNIPFNSIVYAESFNVGKKIKFISIPKNKDINSIKFFEKIGSEIGLLFQIADDLIDYRGKAIKVGKKTRKDQKQGKATLISLLGYQNTIIYGEKIKSKILAKNRIIEDFMLVETSKTLDCFDLARTSKKFQTKVYGKKISFQNPIKRKTLIVSAF